MSRICKVESWVCRRESTPGTPSFKQTDQRRRPFGSESVVLRLTADDGFEGIASCLAAFSTSQPLSYLHDTIAPAVLGRDPLEREAIWQEFIRIDRASPFSPSTCQDLLMWRCGT